MMNVYEFLSEMRKLYPNFIIEAFKVDRGLQTDILIKYICEYIEYTGSYLKYCNYDCPTDYDYKVILDYIKSNEFVKSKLLFHEL